MQQPIVVDSDCYLQSLLLLLLFESQTVIRYDTLDTDH